MREAAALLLIALVATGIASAQTSASYKLEEHVFNAGGHPEAGTVLSSGSYQITLDSIGEGLSGAGLSSSSYSMDGGFPSAFPPPGEVLNLVMLAADQTLEWDVERSAGSYNLYRDLISGLAATDLGDCEQQGIAGTTTTDPATPPATDGYYYLVTVDNRIGEEGTMGFDGLGAERDNLLGTPCP